MWKKARYGLFVGVAAVLMVVNFFMLGFPGAIEYMLAGGVIGGFVIWAIFDPSKYGPSWAEIYFLYGFIWPFCLLFSYAMARSVYKPSDILSKPDSKRTIVFILVLVIVSALAGGFVYLMYM